MSKIAADNLRASTAAVETPMQYPVRGSAKAYAAYDLSIATPTISDSFNLSSLTDNGTGDATLNWTSAMALTKYSIGCAQTNATSNTSQYVPKPRGSTDLLVGSLRMYSLTPTDTLFDYAYTCAIVHGMIA